MITAATAQSMSMSPFRFALALVVLAGSPLACSSSAAAPDGLPAVLTPARSPTIRFFSERDGFASAVDAIVYSDEFHVRLDGFVPGAEVVLTTRMYSASQKDRGYVSEVTFAANVEGWVDTSISAAVDGSYRGVDADGVVWSAVATELPEGLGPDRKALFFEARSGETMVASSLSRTFTTPDVEVVPVTEDGLVAELVLPPNVSDKIPIVAFGGSEGGIGGGESYAARFASWGHPVLALAYFGLEGLPADLDEVPLEYFEKAFAYLDRRPETRKGKAIVVGGSRGGELALLLGATFENNVVGVIADTPSSYVWAGLSGDGSSAWTRGGTPLPHVPSSFAVAGSKKLPNGKPAVVLRPLFEANVKDATKEQLDAARIPVERARGPILMFGGSADDMWPACDFIEEAKARLEASGHSAEHGDEGVCFDGAGHAVSSVGLAMTDSMWALLQGQGYSLGGTAVANARAGRARDRKVRAFLERVGR
jgi:pimeloyl-ACP methyl ester carboxylesterase